MYMCILMYKKIVLLKKIEGKECFELSFETTGFFSSLKASPSLYVYSKIICFENMCILKEAIPLHSNPKHFCVKGSKPYILRTHLPYFLFLSNSR